MPYALKGRNVLVAAGSRGLGALIAEKFGAEGCNVAINYSQSKDRAEALAKKIEQEHGVKTVVLKGDMGIQADCRNVVRKSIESLNGLDVIIANAGWTKPCDFGNLGGLTEEEWDKCWAINTKSNLWLISEAESTFKANADGGVFLITSSIAGIAPSGSSMAYSVTKAAGLQLMQCLAQTQGPKIRVNAILPGLLLTEWWGEEKAPKSVQDVIARSVLKKETILEDCADAFIAAAKNSSMTGEKIRVDSGLQIR